MRAHPAVWLVLLLPIPAGLEALTIVPPRTLADLAAGSDAVVLARCEELASLRRGPLIFTETAFSVLEAVSGPLGAGASVRVEAPGGELEGEAWLVPGSPRFRPGREYFLSLVRKSDGRDVWVPRMLSHGLLQAAAGPNGEAVLVPLETSHAALFPRQDGAPVEAIVPYEKTRLLSHLRRVLRGEERWDARRVQAADLSPEEPQGGGAGFPSQCAFFTSDGRSFRWDAFDRGGWATIYANAEGDPSLRGGGFWSVQEAMDLWMDVTGTSMNLVFGGARRIAIGCGNGQDSVENFVLFGDPCSDIADLSGCSGTLAFGGPRAEGVHTSPGDGDSWWTVTGWIVVVNDGAGCLGEWNYRLMMAHELGHGLGFDHVADSGAVMFASCCNSINSTDRSCARFAYPARDGSNARPRADAGEDRRVALLGDTIRIAGTANDDGLPRGGRLDTLWTQLSGPGRARFSDPLALATDVSFSQSGEYLLGLRVHDGELLHVDQVEVEVDVFVGSSAQLVFQERTGGYAGTADTFLREDAPSAQGGSATELSVDGDDPGGSGRSNQVLLRFDGIFGSGAGQVPPGSEIRAAWLELQTTNTGDGAALHRMRTAWSETSTWSSFGADGVRASEEAHATPDAVSSGSGEPARIDVRTSVEAWSDDPASNHGWVFLPQGSDGWDFESSEGATPPRLLIEYHAASGTEFVAPGETWDFFKGTASPPAAWNAVEFTPGAGWDAGPTGIGYGDGDDATVLADMRGRYLTVYCRRPFTVDHPRRIGRLELEIDYDDGFVAYLNGVEAARSPNMGAPGSAVSRTTEAAFDREAGIPESYALDPRLLREGANVLAIEVHNANLSSSDLSLLPSLFGEFVLVTGDAQWSYLPGSVPPPSEWAAPHFDDAAWARGPAGIGYGDGDDATELLDMQGNYISVFCRTGFDVDCPEAVESLELTAVYDDGIVLYLNGTEVARANMPPGAPGPATAAQSGIEPAVMEAALPPNLLREGRNVLAASVHNSSLGSSDLTFMAMLVPRYRPAEDAECGPPLRLFRRGDTAGDGTRDISDAVGFLIALFQGGTALECPDAADTDDNGELNITDAIALLAFLFQGGTPPPPPGGTCGVDPTEDALGECAAGGCD